MRILGIDPGLLRTGYGLVEAESTDDMRLLEAGVVRTSTGESISSRVKDIFSNLEEIITEYRPEVLVLEKLYSHYKHPVTSILMGHARGVVCLACGIHGVELVSYPSTRIKKAVTGNGRAGKHQVQNMVRTLLGLNAPPEPFDVSDALAMAISYVYIELDKKRAGRRKA
ncbi:MAG: crossover junction endodeoxyribonuclease RuvC [Candidatus Omnitrophica bacterium]|nr:crossover junction endodeoxyribonuclease RuvC [Candidatus Omnitrophota bacterium]MDD5488913.1 crossover junction endodeoxyribonuclease RuvC [Candidatus Omnitrophota bacterium]